MGKAEQGLEEGRPSDALASVGALAEPSRRALYEYVVGRQDWVSRDQAADALGLRRGIAAHHLDRLVDDGLLAFEFRRLTGRTGPGAGRPAKVYRRAPEEVSVSFPPRRYDLAGEVLAAAADNALATQTPIAEAIDEAARNAGRNAASAGANDRRGAASNDPRGAFEADLAAAGFEPQTLDDGTTVLHNCPFHQLAQRHTELICGVNLSFMQGLLEEHPGVRVCPDLAPEEGFCCVRFRPSDEA